MEFAGACRRLPSASTSQDLDMRIYAYGFPAGHIDKSPKVSFRDAKGKNL